MSRKMTKEDLALAQSLHDTYEHIHKHADRLDPKRARDTDLVRKLDAIITNTAHAFRILTGRYPTDVHFWELSTEDPAEWTKNVPDPY